MFLLHLKYALFLCFYLIAFLNLSFAQAIKGIYRGAPLNRVLSDLEEHFFTSINFDVDKLSEYTFSGTISFRDLDTALDEILNATPFAYEIDEKFVLIFLPEKVSYRVCGTLLNEIDKSPLAFASIYAEGLNIGVQSDAYGYFDFTVSAYRSQKIYIRYLGYSPLDLYISNWKNQNCLTLSLDPYSLEIEPIVIQEYILPGISEGNDYGGIQINFNRASRNILAQEYDVLKTVQILPGVTSIDGSAGNLSIRGSTPDQNLISWEGATLYDPGHIFGMLSSINPFVIDKVDVYRGSFAPNFDNRVGGIVNISLRDQVASSTRLGGGSTLSEAHAFIETPVVSDKLSLLLAGRNTLGAFLNSPTLFNYTQQVFQTTKIEEAQAGKSKGIKELDQELNYYDVNGKLIFRPNEKLFFKMAYIRSRNDFFSASRFIDGSLETQDQMVYSSDAFSSGAEIKWNDIHKTSLLGVRSLYKNAYHFSIVEPEDSTSGLDSDADNEIQTTRIRVLHRNKLNDHLDINYGYSYISKQEQHQFLQVSQYEGGKFEMENNIGRFHNFFSSFDLDKTLIKLNGGMRSSYYSEARTWSHSPRLNLQISLSPTLKINFSAGQFSQFISQLKDLGKDELPSLTNIWVLTAPEDEFLKAKKVSLGGIFARKGWLLEWDSFYHQTRGLANISTSLSRGLDIDASGRSEVLGLDFLVKKRWENLHLGMNYSLSKNEYYFPTIQERVFAAPNDQRHILSFTHSSFLKDWEFSSIYQYKSGLPFSQPIGVTQRENTLGDPIYELSFDNLKDQRLTDYHRLDLSIAYRKNLKKEKLSLETSCSVLNLLDRNNIFSRQFELRAGEGENPEPFYLEKSLLGRTFLFLLRVYWE